MKSLKPLKKPQVSGDGEPVPDRRAELLRIAARQFAETGYEAATMRSIADEASMLPGSIYHHFATKDEMLDEIIKSSSAQSVETTRRIARTAADAETRLARLIVLSIWEISVDQQARTILYNDRQFFRRSPQFAYVGEHKAAVFAEWQAVVADGVKAGLFREDLDSFLAITTTVRILNTTADWFRSMDNPYSLDDLTAFLIKFVLGAVRAPARAAAPLPPCSLSDLAEA
jgi:TetR/AcrR family transcriptional regulator, cholesterol catabolism regulator